MAENHAAYPGGHEGTDERCEDAHNPAKHAPLIQPCLADPHGQCGNEKNQRDGHRATDTRLRESRQIIQEAKG